jgi:hypothetical protein
MENPPDSPQPDVRVAQKRLILGFFGMILVGALLIWLVGVLEPDPVVTPSVTPPAAATPEAGSPAATPTTEAELPSSNPQITPVIRGVSVRLNGWSPDNQWVAVWVTTEETAAEPGFPYPPARLNFYQPASGRICTHPEMISSSYAPGIWLPDGRLAVAENEPIRAGLPCGDFSELSAEAYTAAVVAAGSDRQVSPGGDYRAFTTEIGRTPTVVTLRTQLTDLSRGQVVADLTWQDQSALGAVEEIGTWVNRELFLIPKTLENGPLLLGIQGEIVRVAPDLFGVDPVINPDPENYTALFAVAAQPGVNNQDENQPYHLLLMGVGVEGNFPQVRLYHSETGEVEVLPADYLAGSGFTRGGEFILLDMRSDSTGYEINNYAFRPVDPPGAAVQMLVTDSGSFNFAPDNTYVALTWQDGRVQVKSFPANQIVAEWQLLPYTPAALHWAGDNSALAVIAIEQRQTQAYNENLLILPLSHP